MRLFDWLRRAHSVPAASLRPAPPTAAALAANRDRQLAMASVTLAQFRRIGVGPAAPLSLDFLFYTPDQGGAHRLTQDLLGMGYTAAYGSTYAQRDLFQISGATPPIEMADGVVMDWVERMCDLGAAHGCEFDGWGAAAPD